MQAFHINTKKDSPEIHPPGFMLLKSRYIISRNRNTLRGHFSISNHIKNLIEPLDRENSAHHFDIYFVFVALKAKAVKIFKEKLITTVTSSGHYVIHLTANFQYSS